MKKGTVSVGMGCFRSIFDMLDCYITMRFLKADFVLLISSISFKVSLEKEKEAKAMKLGKLS